jgi:hypothetical protein
MIGRGIRSNCQRIFLIFPRPEGGAGFSTLHSAGLSRTGCYGVIGPDPSAVLDKFKRLNHSPLEIYQEAVLSLQLDDIYHNVVQKCL